jgi:hypothetical protein
MTPASLLRALERRANAQPRTYYASLRVMAAALIPRLPDGKHARRVPPLATVAALAMILSNYPDCPEAVPIDRRRP